MKLKSYLNSFGLLLVLTGIVAPNLILSNPGNAASTSIAATSSKWRKFSPPGGDFSILMPATPKKESETEDAINPKTGKMEKKTEYSFTVDNLNGQDGTVYIVSYFDSSATTLITSSTQEDLDIGLNIASSLIEAQSPGLIQRKQKLRLNGNPGTEIKLGFKDEKSGQSATLWTRVFCTRRPNNQIRTYQVVAFSMKEQALQRTLEGFFNSFKLIDK